MGRDGEFAARFGRDFEVAADAPGRVNLIGEHTDYNDGYVLPTAIPQRTRVELARRDDGVVRIASTALEGAGAIEEYRLGAEERRGRWVDYVQGCTRELARAGHRIGGFDALVSSRVPVGAGVSSSAALEVSLMRALRDAFGLALDDVTLARLGQRAENDFVGARVGIMDQMAASLADERTALFLDARTLAWERVELPDAAEILVIDSGIPHGHAGGKYNTRRTECEQAAARLGVRALRDVALERMTDIEALAEPLRRRARHVVTENARVLDAVAAMRAGDVAALGRLMRESHASLRDDFEVTVPDIDALVGIAQAHPDVYGARMTGGGFGGSIVALACRGAAAAAGADVDEAYRARTGRTGAVLVPDRAATKRRP